MKLILIFVALVLIASCSPPQSSSEPSALPKSSRINDQQSCCQECLASFRQSPVGIGAEGVKCGHFSSSELLSPQCQEYFNEKTMLVAECLG